MPFEDRIKYASFIDNKESIEGKWDKEFGDRLNELVIIGQDLEKEKIEKQLDDCLCNAEEINQWKQGKLIKDEWPI